MAILLRSAQLLKCLIMCSSCHCSPKSLQSFKPFNFKWRKWKLARWCWNYINRRKTGEKKQTEDNLKLRGWWCVTFHPDCEEGSAGWAKREGGDPLPSGAAGCLEGDHSRWNSHQTAITSLLVMVTNLYLWLHTDLVEFFLSRWSEIQFIYLKLLLRLSLCDRICFWNCAYDIYSHFSACLWRREDMKASKDQCPRKKLPKLRNSPKKLAKQVRTHVWI